MYVLLVRCEAEGRRSSIHLVDEDGRLEFSTSTMQVALRWLVDRGEETVTAMADDGPELFLIEPCEGLQMTLPSLSLRRAYHGRCCDPPPLPGLRPDPTRFARILDDAKVSPLERRRRRENWVRRATADPANDNAR